MRKWKYADKIAFMQSVVKYLERHNIAYKEEGDALRIYTSDLFHTREICEYLGIIEGKYFENGKLSPLLRVQDLDENEGEDEKSRSPLSTLRNSMDQRDQKIVQTTLQEIMLFPFYWAVTLVIEDLIQEVYFGTSSNSEYTQIDFSIDVEYDIRSPQNSYWWEFHLDNGAQLIHIGTIDWKNVVSPVVYHIDIYNNKNEFISYTLTLKDAFTQGTIVDLLFVPKKGRLIELVRES